MILKETKILLVGDYPVPVYTGVLGSYKRAFEALHYTTVEFYFNINTHYLRFAKYWNAALKLLVHKEQIRFLKFIKENKITHIIVFKGSYVLSETIEEIKARGIIIVNINPDNPYNTVRTSANSIIREGIPHYNYYFLWSKEICNRINHTLLNNNAVYLPFAVDKTLIDFQPDFNNINYNYPIAFIANADKERIIQIKALLKYDKNIRKDLFVFGSGWRNSLEITNKEKQVVGKDYFKTIAQSKINLNFLRKQNKGAHNMRTFEIPACGGFMLHEYSEEAMDLFKADEQAVYFSSIEECLDKIKFYLKQDKIRLKIAQNGYLQAMKYENSYEARVKQIIKLISISE